MTRSTNISLLKIFFGKIYRMLFFIFNHTPLPSPYLPKAIAQVGLLTFSFFLSPSPPPSLFFSHSPDPPDPPKNQQ